MIAYKNHIGSKENHANKNIKITFRLHHSDFRMDIDKKEIEHCCQCKPSINNGMGVH